MMLWHKEASCLLSQFPMMHSVLWCIVIHKNSVMLWHREPSCLATSTTPHRPNCLFSFSVGEDRDSQLFETVRWSEDLFKVYFWCAAGRRLLRRLRIENSDWIFWPHSSLTIGDKRELEAAKLDRTECQEGSWFFQLCYNHVELLLFSSTSYRTEN